MGNSEGNRISNKLGISDGEVPVIKLRVVEKIKLGGDEVARKFLSGGSCEGERYGYLEYGSEDLEDSAL